MTATATTESAATLAEKTRSTLDAFMATLNPEQQQIIMGAFTRLLESDCGDKAVRVGDPAPDFSLPLVKGGNVKLSHVLRDGPVVLNFYRGGWCPFCQLEFRAIHDYLPYMQSLGARVIGLSPETIETSRETIEQQHLEFEVVSDQGTRVARKYGLIMTVDEAVRPLYQEWGIDLITANGNDTYELPLPATYVIDTSGIVRAAYVNKDYTTRMEPTEIVAALQELAGK